MIWMMQTVPAFVGPTTAFAQITDLGKTFGFITTDIPGCDFVTGKLTAMCIPAFIGHAVVIIFAIAGTIFLLSIIWAGFRVAMGYEDGYERLQWSIIGFALCALVVVLINLVLDLVL